MRRPFLNQSRFRTAGALAVALVLAAGTAATAEESSTVFDWGDNDKTVDSGKSHISFQGPANAGDVIVSFGDRKLYYITAPGQADTYPIAVPKDSARWQGVTRVTQKRENPAWTPTSHMMTVNPRLPRWVPGGHPMNPLGIRAMYLGSSDYRIHGTDAPWTIGTAASSGCVRMFNKDVLDLYPKVKVGAKVTVTWEKFDSKTLAMAEKAVAVSDPDPDHGYAAGRVQPAAFSGDESEQSVKGKVQKASVTETVGSVVENPDDRASLVAPPETPSEPRRKYRSHKPTIVDNDSKSEASAKSDKPETFAKADSNDEAKESKREKTASVSDKDDAPAKPAANRADAEKADKADAKPRRSARRVPTQDADSDEAAALVVAKRAVAAAEKAAQAAERAAAAAERAAAASSQVQDKAAAPAASGDAASGTVKSY